MTVFGLDPETPPLPECAARRTPRRALEAALLSGLRRPPCVVAFSGGRDSSLLLALAVHVARREGLEPPVALTLRFPQSPTAEESAWQELVVRHVGIDNWIRREIHDELDFVGPLAQRTMLRHGLLWPANLHFVAPPAAEAAGGALVTGVGGDRVLSSGPDDILGRPRLRATVRRLALGVHRSLPARARAPHYARRLRERAPWLRSPAVDAVVERMLTQPYEPRSCAARLDHIHRERLHALLRHGVGLLAKDENAQAVMPFLEPDFLTSLSGFLGARGIGGRTALMRVLAGDLLPEQLVTRPTKAVFPEAYCNRHTRDFVQSWRGGGVDDALVDVDRLRLLLGDGTDHHWLGRSAILLQSAWLAEADQGRAGRRATVAPASETEPKESPMSVPPNTPVEPSDPREEQDFEPPAIIALGKLDEVTFGAPGEPFEGATSYL